MIDVERMTRATRIADKDIVPPQLFNYWCEIFDSTDSRPYVISARHGGAIVETLSFVIIDRPFGRFLFSMPFIGYGCCFDASSIEDAREILGRLEEIGKEEDCLTMSVATHPLQTLDIGGVWEAPFKMKNFCQILDTTEHPLGRMSSKRRNAVRNETQYVTKRSSFFIDPDPDRAIFDKWYEVYLKLSGEQGTVPQRKDLFERYWSMPRADIDFWVLKNEEEVAGGIFFAKGKGITDYNTSAFDSRFKGLCCTTHVLHAYFSKMVRDHVRYFNMQSSKKFQDGTYRYKERWGADLYWHDIVSKNLVDLDTIRNIPLDTVKRDLPGCYVLPYSIWDPKEIGKDAIDEDKKAVSGSG